MAGSRRTAKSEELSLDQIGWQLLPNSDDACATNRNVPVLLDYDGTSIIEAKDKRGSVEKPTKHDPDKVYTQDLSLEELRNAAGKYVLVYSYIQNQPCRVQEFNTSKNVKQKMHYYAQNIYIGEIYSKNKKQVKETLAEAAQSAIRVAETYLSQFSSTTVNIGVFGKYIRVHGEVEPC
ncbi:hypothetical protein LPJ74_003181 [Coemansia sp. RSA 1843]|nr:hypothetical protein LPJ74_003181 [Coemansia sp. RSA 1843]